MLLQNITILAQNAGFRMGGATGNEMSILGLRDDMHLNRFAGEGGIAAVQSIPAGYPPGYTWAPSRSAGGIAAYAGVEGIGGVTANLAGGKWAVASLAGVADFVSAITGKGILSGTLPGTCQVSGNLAGVLNALATLSGEGAVTPTISGILAATAALAGAGVIDSAALKAVVGLLATLTGDGEIAANLAGGKYGTADLAGAALLNVDLRAKAWLEATLAVGGEQAWPTADEIAQAVRGELSPELTEINQAKAVIANRLRINKTTGEWTVYDDDGVTPLYTGTLTDDGTFRDRVPS